MSGVSLVHRFLTNMRFAVLLGFLLTTLTACSTNTILPSGDTTTSSVCATFAECTEIYEKIELYQTKVADLESFGLSPKTTANMRMLNFSDIIERFNYSADHGSAFPKGVRECVEALDHCRGFDLVIKRLQEERTGDTILDLMQFERKTNTKGWIFKLLLVIKDDLIVYKLMGGTPNVDETSVKTKPLGLLQDGMGGLLPF